MQIYIRALDPKQIIYIYNIFKIFGDIKLLLDLHNFTKIGALTFWQLHTTADNLADRIAENACHQTLEKL
jgi:hypothetical protein